MITKFKAIPGYEHYSINRYGVILRPFQRRKNKRGRRHTYKEMFISTRVDKRSGYLVVKLTDKNGRDHTFYVHRLVALTFLDNPGGKPFVNHDNGNKTDPTLSNLSWVTSSENSKHAIQHKLLTPFQKTPVIDTCNDKEYGSIKEAADDMGIDYTTLKSTLSGIVSCFQCIQRKNNNVSIN